MSVGVALVVGPAEHGVVRHARLLAGAAGWPVVTRAQDVPPGSTVVLDVTDRLWGSTSDVSGPAVATALDTLRAGGCRVVTAVHDVPFAGDGAVMARRAVVYRSIVQRSDAVFVCSEVERERLAAITALPERVAVLPLPVPRAVDASRAVRGRRPESVTVLGFLYPGKGHDEVLTAMRELPADIALVCVGRASDGHDDLVHALTATADREVRVTGFVPDDGLAAFLHAPTVPVTPNRVVSSSASVATWWGHGRRPLVPDLPYTREVADAATVAYYDDDLAGSLHRAFEAPASTWLGEPAGPTADQVARTRDDRLTRWFA